MTLKVRTTFNTNREIQTHRYIHTCGNSEGVKESWRVVYLRYCKQWETPSIQMRRFSHQLQNIL